MSRPRVKPEHAPYRIAGGKIRIGGVACGLAAEISDPDGWVWMMLSAMDGSRAPQEIVEYVQAGYPAEPVGALRRAPQRRSGGTWKLLVARAVAKPGLMTVLISRRRSSNGANALFIALSVSHSMSDQP